jgi:hypothetical protein
MEMVLTGDRISAQDAKQAGGTSAFRSQVEVWLFLGVISPEPLGLPFGFYILKYLVYKRVTAHVQVRG